MTNRCINIDWLEVFCYEDTSFNYTPDDFINRGYVVDVRAYGTRMYASMFTIIHQGKPWLEVRRDPLSRRSDGGIFEDGATHIRLCNRTCYHISPIDELRNFLIDNQYQFVGITRCDICCDFIKFDRGDNPQKIIKQYMIGAISKINQCNLHAHGRDQWDGRFWNSLKWGSESSAVSTKLYDKTLELDREGHDKPYIRQVWEQSQLCSRQVVQYESTQGKVKYKTVMVPYGTATQYPRLEQEVTKVKVWRCEFSISSQGKRFVHIDSGQVFEMGLDTIDSRYKCLFLFHVLANHYFHFKIMERKADGGWQRKDRCKDKILFRTGKMESAYKPIQLQSDKTSDRTKWLIIHKMDDIANDFLTSTKQERFFASTIKRKLLDEMFDAKFDNNNQTTSQTPRIRDIFD